MNKWIFICSFILLLVAAPQVVDAAEKEVPFVVCIDAGHQKKGDNTREPIAPGISETKARVSSGTEGVGTKNAEHMINLSAAKILKSKLIDAGYTVVMTREVEDVNISNAERAQIANNANAQMTIRIHCDSIQNANKTGATILVPSKSSKYTKNIYESSYEYAKCLENELKQAGIKVNGIVERADMTGFNWSKVPVVIFEMGFMSNWNEDKMLGDTLYQEKLMDIVLKALNDYNNKI
ncbi:MAG: N-acetylmuramoyl-L-alanine amidase [Cellulosilyticaceae bacterium]